MRHRKLSLLAAIAASVTSPLAFGVVDGTVTGGEYTTTLALQNTPTQFGDNFSELNAAYANYTPGSALELALTGNIEANGNSVVLFVDSKANGGTLYSDPGGFNGVGPQAGFRTDDWNGATLAPNFNPDYSLEFSNDAAGYYFNVIDMALAPGDPNKDIYMGQFNPATGPYSSDYYRDGGATLAGNIQHHLNNTNTAGVNGYDGGNPPGPLGDPTTATTGFEFALDSTFLGYTPGHAVRAFAFITNGGGDYLSNQFLPGVNGLPNLAGPGGDGGGSIFDSRVFTSGDKMYLELFCPTTSSSGGAWSAATWTGAFAPNGAEHAARLEGTTGSTMSIPTGGVSVGYLDFNNAAGWTVSGDPLTFNGGSGSAVVFASQGNHTISAPVAITTDTRVNTGANAITLSGGLSMAAGKRITKAGTGTLTIGGTQTNGAGSSIATDAGSLVLNSDLGTGLAQADRPEVFISRDGANGTATFNTTQHLKNLHVNNTGVVTIAPSGGLRAVVTDTFSADPTGKIDIKDNKLIVQTGTLGTWDGGSSVYTGLTGEVQRGRGSGAWDGTGGIVTSMSDATSGVLTTVAISSGNELRGLGPLDTDLFLGETITGDSVLLMYTWGGDADLNGELNGDDYFFIDSNAPANGSVFGFHQGDFDYNGTIDGDDYFVIDSNITFAQASPPFPTGSGGGGLAAVPEPASASLLALGASALLRRRRRH